MKILGSLILGSALALGACTQDRHPSENLGSVKMPSYLKPYDSNKDLKIDGKELDLLADDVLFLRRTGLISTSPFRGWEDFVETYVTIREFYETHGGTPSACLDYSGNTK